VSAFIGLDCPAFLDREQVFTNPLLSLFQKVLLATDGSVTELLRIYTGREIRARKIEQCMRPGNASELPGGVDGTPLLHRKIMLVDGDAPLVYAESIFILDRLTTRTRTALLETDTPIGLLWREEKLEMYREIVDLRIERHPDIARQFDVPEDTCLLSRTYLLLQSGQPLGTITEKFPTSSFRR